jgi:hypothetical protein
MGNIITKVVEAKKKGFAEKKTAKTTLQYYNEKIT